MAKADSYTWRPLWWAMALAGVEAAWWQFLNFVSCAPPTFGGVYMVRDFLNIFSPVGALLLLGFAVVLILCMAVAFVKLRFRRMFSLGCAAIAIPLVLVTVLRLAVFSPYYWYVLLNQSDFESEAKAEAQSGSPTFAKLEGRDVSVGLAINPPTFTSIVYDESDELGLGPAKRSAGWNARNGAQLSMDGGGAPMIYTARHLHGHFYLVSSTYP